LLYAPLQAIGKQVASENVGVQPVLYFGDNVLDVGVLYLQQRRPDGITGLSAYLFNVFQHRYQCFHHIFILFETGCQREVYQKIKEKANR